MADLNDLPLFAWCAPARAVPHGPARIYLFPISRNERLVHHLAEGVIRRGGVGAARWLDNETKVIGSRLRAAGIPAAAAEWEITNLLSRVGFRLHDMHAEHENGGEAA
jgi:hypothetical protein